MEAQVSSILILCYPQQRTSISWLKVAASDPAITSASQPIGRGEGRHGGWCYPSPVRSWTRNGTHHFCPHLISQNLLLTSPKCKECWKNVDFNETVMGLAKTQRLYYRGRRKDWLLGNSRQSCPRDKTRSIDPCIEFCLDKAYFLLNTQHFVFTSTI